MTMRDYARLETAALLHRLSRQVEQASEAADADAIHDLRVVIRRLNRCLRIFAQFYPGNSVKKLRKKLGQLMDMAGAIRDRDIAISLLAEAGLSPRSAAITRIAAEREKKGNDLMREVKNWRRLHRWNRKLEL